MSASFVFCGDVQLEHLSTKSLNYTASGLTHWSLESLRTATRFSSVPLEARAMSLERFRHRIAKQTKARAPT